MDMTITVNKTQQSLVEFSTYLTTATKEEAIESIRSLAQMESEDWFRIGMILSSYRKTKGDEEFKGLLEYAEEHLQINGRKAYYLIAIHDSLVDSNITPTQVSEVGWTKLKEIAHLLTPTNVDYWVDVCKSNTTKQLVALLKSGVTTNAEKSASIDAALEETPANTETAFAEPVVTGIDVAEEGAEGTAIATVVEGTIDNVEFPPTAKYEGVFSEPTEDFPDVPVSYKDEPKAQVEVLEEAPPEATVVATDTATDTAPDAVTELDTDNSKEIMELAVKLKIYELDTIVAMVSEIYPHITITVSENHDAAITD